MQQPGQEPRTHRQVPLQGHTSFLWYAGCHLQTHASAQFLGLLQLHGREGIWDNLLPRVSSHGLDDTKLKRLSPKFTLNLKVGYKPSDEVEIFFNANNLFNNKTREMVFSDKVGGLYTVGVNFAF